MRCQLVDKCSEKMGVGTRERQRGVQSRWEIS